VKLEQFLKWQGLVGTGGEAKQRVQRGDVRVNGSIETRRGRQLATGDAVEMDGIEHLVLPAGGANEHAGWGPLGLNLSHWIRECRGA
jgi:ribosome-associated protein